MPKYLSPLLTELIPKVQVTPISPAQLSLPGYVMYSNFDPSHRGLGASGSREICIYVSERLKVSEVTFTNPFHEQLCISVKLVSSDRLLISCISRSPSSDSHASVINLGNLLYEVCSAKPSHPLVVSDFTIPHIDWDTQFSAAPEQHYSHTLKCPGWLFVGPACTAPNQI